MKIKSSTIIEMVAGGLILAAILGWWNNFSFAELYSDFTTHLLSKMTIKIEFRYFYLIMVAVGFVCILIINKYFNNQERDSYDSSLGLEPAAEPEERPLTENETLILAYCGDRQITGFYDEQLLLDLNKGELEIGIAIDKLEDRSLIELHSQDMNGRYYGLSLLAKVRAHELRG